MLRTWISWLCLMPASLPSSSTLQDPAAGRGKSGGEEGRPVDLYEIRRHWSVEVNGPIILLLYSSAVQEELGLTSEQMKRVESLEQERKRGLTDMLKTLMRRSNEEGKRGIDQESLTAGGLAFNRELDAKIRESLEPEQYRRLLEITLQILGPLAVVRPEIQRQLNVPPPQAELIEDVHRQYQEAIRPYEERRREIMAALNRERDSEKVRPLEEQLAEIDEELKGTRDKAVKALAKILTRRQEERFDKMLGEPFVDMAELMPPGLTVERFQGRTEKATGAKDADRAPRKD